MKPNNPIHAVVRWIIGLSSATDIFSPSDPRREVMVKRMKKMMLKPMETAMKAGVVDVGAVNRSGAPLGRLERSGSM